MYKYLYLPAQFLLANTYSYRVAPFDVIDVYEWLIMATIVPTYS